MGEKPVEIRYKRFRDGPDVPVAENPHFFALIRFLCLIGNTAMAIEWNFEDLQMVFDSEELTEYSRNLHLRLLGFLGKRFPPHVTLERNISKFLDERPIDVGEIFWDKVGVFEEESGRDSEQEGQGDNEKDQNMTDSEKDASNGNEGFGSGRSNKEELDTRNKSSVSKNKGKNKVKSEFGENKEYRLYNPYRDREYRDVDKHERLRAIRIILNVCIQESKQLRNIFQGMDGYSLKCKHIIPGECFFGSSPPYIGDDKLGHHYWYISLPNDEVMFRLYRESSSTGELTLISDNSDTLCSTYKTFLNDDSLKEVGLVLESKYNSLVVAEKAKLRKIRQMRSIRNQLESSWGNCAPTEEMLTSGRTKRRAAMNIDYYSYTRNEGIPGTRRSLRINKCSHDSDSISDFNINNAVRDRSSRLANRNAKKEHLSEESEKDGGLDLETDANNGLHNHVSHCEETNEEGATGSKSSGESEFQVTEQLTYSQSLSSQFICPTPVNTPQMGQTPDSQLCTRIINKSCASGGIFQNTDTANTDLVDNSLKQEFDQIIGSQSSAQTEEECKHASGKSSVDVQAVNGACFPVALTNTTNSTSVADTQSPSQTPLIQATPSSGSLAQTAKCVSASSQDVQNIVGTSNSQANLVNRSTPSANAITCVPVDSVLAQQTSGATPNLQGIHSSGLYVGAIHPSLGPNTNSGLADPDTKQQFQKSCI